MSQPDHAPSLAPRPRRWAHTLLRLVGWRIDLPPPTAAKVLLIVYPHTSNWDFPLGLLARWACGWPVRWIGKHTIFVGPFNRLLRSWGGIPVNRAATGGFIETLAADIRRRDTLILAMAPEGTRRRLDHWKSGFLRIARAADMQLGLAYIDFATRTIGIRSYMTLSGDDAADMARITEAYQGVVGYHPELASPIRLRPPANAAENKP
ncbi:1-acyl-sn-glycerol-3-phosphate acyltransferase [Niveibacterium microcysteis]|uniref:1-acyl-sn-glycerol-3-phosphate acyltransferase n=1 Tax=Niveibacterium microcysteis TaxID=2811415 RepID=A0ABX7M6W3_9RHOO|nr:1-acyl-sn-glycerol-3-phosphate acyltransferase [Niveibacterium microcysteis]QSI77497.1 1-acyl-sn-glycerol-3-phosphate acyltransferase [Niveibacterium microcysteis]